MNVALIIAGGIGGRSGYDVPKQFVQVNGRPVLAYTMKKFQNHPKIDAICVVALRGWESCVIDIGRRYGITKLYRVVTGGATGQESIYNGLVAVQKCFSNDVWILIHDAVRPVIPIGIIDDVIRTAQKCGNAVSGVPCYEALCYKSGIKCDDHGNLWRVQAPCCFQLKDLLDLHHVAQMRGIKNSVTSATLAIELGRRVFWARGSNKNIKLTVPADFEMFQAMLNWGPDEYNFNE